MTRDASTRLPKPRDVPLLTGKLAGAFGIVKLNATRPPTDVFCFHRHAYHEVFWLEEGAGTHFRDFGKAELGAGNLVLVPPGQMHTWEWRAGPVGYVLGFTNGFVSAGLGRLGESGPGPVAPLSGGPGWVEIARERRGYVSMLCAEMLREAGSAEAHRESRLRAMLELLLIEAARGRQDRGAVRPSALADPTVSTFIQLLEEHHRRVHRAGDYAEMLRLSPQSLSRILKENTGSAPSDFIEQRLLLEARRLLVHSSMTISEIAYHLGFATPSNFGRFFKAGCGVSPGAARSRGGCGRDADTA